MRAADVVAFGDMPNDADLLEWAGAGVAMGNAHPAVLAVADDVTLSNDEDGVAHWLASLRRRRYQHRPSDVAAGGPDTVAG